MVKERSFALVSGHGHDDVIEQLRGAMDQVQMAVGQGIEAAGVDHRSHGGILAAGWGMPIQKVRSPGAGCGADFDSAEADGWTDPLPGIQFVSQLPVTSYQ